MKLTLTDRKRLRRYPPSPNRLKMAIVLAGVTNTELAREAGLSQTQLCDIAAGRWQDVSLRTARRLSKPLGVHIEELFPDDVEAR